MPSKRPRSAFEADLQAQQSPYVVYGTPLPPIDPNIRDDGSFVPIWKQEVRDERGRKRLHGAFTGGFSAGYYNTVGSKEGWTPSSFVSSRTKRADESQRQQRPEDYMDDEDRAEAEETRQITTETSFAALGSTDADVQRQATIMDLLRPSGETMGERLLGKMGWRPGQGVGPRVRRKARLHDGDQATLDGTNSTQTVKTNATKSSDLTRSKATNAVSDGEESEERLFAPSDSEILTLDRKDDTKGLGYHGEARLDEQGSAGWRLRESQDDEEDSQEPKSMVLDPPKRPKVPPRRGGMGVGILNDTGSDDEDSYSIGPRISYNKTVGGEKKTRKTKTGGSKAMTSNANPLLGSKPIFVPRKSGAAGAGFRKCHDGRLPLDGFILATEALSLDRNQPSYPPPDVPETWQPSQQKGEENANAAPYLSSAEMAKQSTLDPAARAQMLGEAMLPGKSVFDFLKPSSRDRIVQLTKNDTLPPAKSEAPPAEPTDTDESLPTLDRHIAASALGRGVAGFIPYADNPLKLARYRAFLSFAAALTPERPKRPPDMRGDEWRKELEEFAHAATIFKPMTGAIASRFVGSGTTTTTAPSAEVTGSVSTNEPLLSKPAAKASDPAEEAAKMNMFGPLTRSSTSFYPSRLLCKRFGVPVPSHVTSANEGNPSSAAKSSTANTSSDAPSQDVQSGHVESRFRSSGFQTTENRVTELVSAQEMLQLRNEAGIADEPASTAPAIDPDRNEALEADRADDALFRAVFGDDSDGE